MRHILAFDLKLRILPSAMLLYVNTILPWSVVILHTFSCVFFLDGLVLALLAGVDLVDEVPLNDLVLAVDRHPRLGAINEQNLNLQPELVRAEAVLPVVLVISQPERNRVVLAADPQCFLSYTKLKINQRNLLILVLAALHSQTLDYREVLAFVEPDIQIVLIQTHNLLLLRNVLHLLDDSSVVDIILLLTWQKPVFLFH